MAGRVVVITGATRGLGRVMTAGLVAAGHTVIGCGRSGTKSRWPRGRRRRLRPWGRPICY
jgi:NAD(P)-dependent dehydrogenase (short-subunit alcohol dehydrogenase family)